MKAGIIRSSTLLKHKRWDAGHYLSDTREIDPAIERAKKDIQDAKARLIRLKEQRSAGEKFLGKLVSSGELIPIQVSKNPKK